MDEIGAKTSLAVAEESLRAAMGANRDPQVDEHLRSALKALNKAKRSMNWA